MRCFVPVTATATEEIFRISIGAWLLPGNRSQSGQHREKKDIFLFIILHYPFWVGRIRISSVVRALTGGVMMKYGTRG
jgi:hypothetical protein